MEKKSYINPKMTMLTLEDDLMTNVASIPADNKDADPNNPMMSKKNYVWVDDDEEDF